MEPSNKSVHASFQLFIPLVVSMLSAVFVPVIAIRYSYDLLFTAAAWIGFLLLLATSGFLWRTSRKENAAIIHHAIDLGMVLGLLWIIEIGINNFIAPGLPARDIIDNIFWAVIALLLFVYTVIGSYREDRIRTGIRVGAWMGIISGIFACFMALSMIVFGMHFIVQDPLNVAEWTLRAGDSNAPTMAAFFAYETLAGAFLHLIVLGLFMGILLGVFGGTVGKVAKQAGRWIRRLSRTIS
jgi:hypothetical protein